jgi:hypothetical protein
MSKDAQLLNMKATNHKSIKSTLSSPDVCCEMPKIVWLTFRVSSICAMEQLRRYLGGDSIARASRAFSKAAAAGVSISPLFCGWPWIFIEQLGSVVSCYQHCLKQLEHLLRGNLTALELQPPLNYRQVLIRAPVVPQAWLVIIFLFVPCTQPQSSKWTQMGFPSNLLDKL